MRTDTAKKMLRRLGAALMPVVVLMGWSGAQAAVSLSITPITWDVIGLDSNNVNAGPNIYPVGARICNVGDVTATGVTAKFVFDGGTTNSYLKLNGLSQVTLDNLPSGTATGTNPHYNSINKVPANCQDAYFNIEITRSRNAYSDRVSDTATPTQRNTQLYHIEATATGLSVPVSTPTPRELYVERLVSQNRNSVVTFSGPSTVSVGQVVQFTLKAKTATGGYEQLENFPVLPNSVYQVLNVSTSYLQPAGAINSSVYGDACGWENNRTSVNYHNNGTCIGPQQYVGGKVGDDMTSVYTVRIISGGGAGIYNLIYDYSGSSYHYNSDYGTSVNGFVVTAMAPDLTVTKTSPSSFVVGQTASYTLTVRTANADAYGTTTVVDRLPTGLSLPDGTVTLSGVNASSWQCTSASNVVTCRSTNVDTPGVPNTPLITAGNSQTFTLNGIVVGAAAAPSVTNTATVSNPNESSANTGNNTGSVTTSVIPSADLVISKTGPVAVGSGKAVSYSIQVWNNGPNSLSGVSVSDTLPTGLTGTTVTCAATGTATCGTQTVTSGVLSATTGSLALDTAPTNSTPDGNFLTYTVTATAPLSGSLSNTASLTVPSTAVDPVTGNNSTSATPVVTRVIDAVNDPVTSISRSVGGNVNVLGNDTNGDVAATNANSTVTITNAGNLTGLTVNSGQLVVPANTTAGSYTVTYQLCDRTLTTACDTATANIQVVAGAAPLNITKTFSPTTITAGGTTTMTLTVTNPNATAATSLSITDNVAASMGYPTPMYLRYVASSSTCGGTASGSENTTGTFSLTGASVAASGSCTVVVEFTPWSPPTGTASNTIATNNVTATVGTATVNASAPASAALTVVAGSAGGNYVCSPDFFQIRQDPTTLLTNLYKLDLTSLGSGGMAQWARGFGPGLNALAYNARDGYFYAVNITAFNTGSAFRLYRLGTSGAVEYANLTNIPTGSTIAAATVDRNGVMYIKKLAQDNVVYRYDLVGNTSLGNLTLNANVYFWDMAVNPLDNKIYGAVTPGGVYVVDPSTGAVTQLGSLANLATDNSNAIGTLFFHPSGTLYAYQNGGVFGTISTTTGAFTATATASAAAQSDGASCAFGAPDLTLVKQGPTYANPSVPATASTGDKFISYTLTVSNSGNAPTVGTVTVTDTLPAGLTATAIFGTGWTCDPLPTLKCTRNDALVMGSTYPVITLVIRAPYTTELESTASLRTITNSATVSVSGETNTSNNTGIATTTMVYAKLTKTVRNVSAGSVFGTAGNGLPAQVLQYCIEYRNFGGSALANFKVTDTFPANTTFVPGSLIYSAPATSMSGAATAPANQVLPSGATYTFSSTGVALNLGANGLSAGGSGVVCFSTTVN
ncbi:beta strand repeat-containing protein [Deinococcus navajonensis]|uniref:Beta strand repeat-containing protein n=1 Tax=Deinococcus navajonensis TaxID=309884 RepID=A0ABV8XQQ1_9DEIO